MDVNEMMDLYQNIRISVRHVTFTALLGAGSPVLRSNVMRTTHVLLSDMNLHVNIRMNIRI